MGEEPGTPWIRVPWIPSIPVALEVIKSTDEPVSVKSDALCMYAAFQY